VANPDKQDFLGNGWHFPPRISGQGGVDLTKDEEKIRQSIRIILETARGERVMHPDFGCGIHDYVFATINTSSINTIRQAVREALILWEPRIEVLKVALAGDRDGSDFSRGILAIAVDYRVRATNSEFNLVYPFYVKREA
jgi:phage baseplate assembly protein W